MNLNKAFVLGRLTRDPDRRNLPSGQAVVSFGVATNRYFTQDGQKREEVEFHNIVAFGRLAETMAQYLRKGSLVLIEGRLKTSSWDDASSGIKRYRTEIIAQGMQLGPRAGGSSFERPTEAPVEPTARVANVPSEPNVSEEEIPVIEEEGPPETSEPPAESPSGIQAGPPQSESLGGEPTEPEKPTEENPDEGEQEIDVKKIPF